ncbi:metallophosphoesterase family protein [Tumebacillus flagellatus]|uniref:Calcineurin-like phosphoesterase domain-containing protein n=1 Tax=Tumebacillus flagellatus TaxID=1157490 RepID=A0A074MDR8_9BACL|nr:metallophosphoesterase [Tumebacillus flagellatus]KEO83982.1 hypothetical protein EL26_07300 [Tumebacillus flagellatus]
MKKRLFPLTFAIVISLLFCLALSPAHSSEREDTPAEKPLPTFGVMSDVHVVSRWEPPHVDGALKFAHALRDLRHFHPDFEVVNGDLTTTGSPQAMSLARQIADDHAGTPVYVTMGNHEYYQTWIDPKWSDESAKDAFRRTFDLPGLYYEKWVRGVHLIFLSPEQYSVKQKQIGEAAWLSDAQLAWFKKTLRSAPDAPTFVFLHQPLDGTVGKTDLGVSAVQTRELLRIASLHPRLVWFSGHSHVSAREKTEHIVKNGVHFFGLGSVYEPVALSTKPAPGAQKRGDGVYMVAHGEWSESRFVEVYRDRIVVKTRLHQDGTWAEHVEIPLR